LSASGDSLKSGGGLKSGGKTRVQKGEGWVGGKKEGEGQEGEGTLLTGIVFEGGYRYCNFRIREESGGKNGDRSTGLQEDAEKKRRAARSLMISLRHFYPPE